ncbi:MAG TPA: rhodanese-like domain-containing protein [Cyclobacteriaceae bacterium]
MKVQQIYTGCLAEAAYYIESNGEAVIIDPLRETTPYLQKAREDNARIKYVMETHFHADFVSGHIDLANKTGAEIVYGPTAQPNFKAHIAKDGEVLIVGDISIKVLHTPGHTMESSTYLLFDENGKEHAIFTGDTLFIGDVGRPDLAVKSDLSREDLAGHLYDSLRNKIMPLPDHVIVYPGHGAGSACGKNMSKETTDTLGNQKMFNYALRPDMAKEEFIKEVTEGLVEPPQYFPKNAVLNKMGYESYDSVMSKGVVALDADEFEKLTSNTNALIIDTRNKEEFIEGYIPGSIFIGLDGSFAPWVGALITDLKQPILYVAYEGKEEEVVTRLSRVGYDNAVGYLKGGLKAWEASGREVEKIEQIDATSLSTIMNKNINVLDVRKRSEFDSLHAESARNFPLDIINKNMNNIDRDKKYYLHCLSGYRSVIASSILKSRGFNNVVDIKGGIEAMKETDISFSDYQEPASML